MGENFIAFKKKALKIRLIKSIAAGLSFGLAAYGAATLSYKFELLPLSQKSAVICAIAAFLLVGTVAFLLLRTSDKTLAKRLDTGFKLNEKVQTMLQYRDEDGTIFELQRDDTDAALASVPLKKLRFKRLWVYVLCLLAGSAVFASSFVLSPPAPPPPEVVPDVPFAISQIQIAALEELIVYVEESEMESPYRENVSLSVRSLLDELKLATTEKEKDSAVSRAMDAIDEQTDASSFALELMNELWAQESDGARALAKAINYYAWPRADEWDKFNNTLTGFRTSFVHATAATENPVESVMITDTEMVLVRVSSQIGVALTRCGIASEDKLSLVLTRFASADETNENGTHLYGFSALAEKIQTLGYKDTQRELDATFTALGSELFSALEQHKANTDTGEYAMTKIASLFGYDEPKFERPELYEVSSDGADDPEGEENGGQSGGIGNGAVYGSDDLVLDPYTNEYVEYGTIIDKYYALMFGKLQDGEYSDAEKEAMEKYFEILYGGFEEE